MVKFDYNMDINIYLICGAIVLASVYIISELRKSKRLNLPPGPLQLPVFGSTLFFYWPLWRWVAEKGHKYGDVIYLSSGMVRRIIVLNGYNTIKEAMGSAVFAGRTQSNFAKEFFRNEGVILSEGSLWKEHRRFMLRVLKDCGFAKEKSEKNILREAKYLSDIISKTSGTPVDLSVDIAKAVSNVISVFVFNKRLGHEDEDFERTLKSMTELTQGKQPPIFVVLLLSILMKLPGVANRLSWMRRIKGLVVGMIGFCNKQIDKHKEAIDFNSEPKDYIERYLVEQRELSITHGDEHTFTDSQLTMSIFDVFMAGTDTTTNTLRWLLLYMSMYPEVQAAVRTQIHDVLGGDACSLNRKPTLPLVEAVIEETQRVSTLVPMAVAHRATRWTKFRGYDIAPDVIITPNLWSVHYDPELFPEPEKFNPHRFIKDGRFVPSEYVIPFGIGKRACLGESLARMELFLFFTEIMRDFKVELPSVERGRLSEILKGTEGAIHAPIKHTLTYIQDNPHFT